MIRIFAYALSASLALTTPALAGGGGGGSGSFQQATSALAATPGIMATANGKPKLVCDRCGGPHKTELCPHFKRPRERHPDATGRGKFLKLSTPGEAKHIEAAEVAQQPGDGSCLFHSISGGVNEPALNARTLRAKVCDFIVQNSDCTIAGNPLKDWIAWESAGASVEQYAERMADNLTWGGGIEMACISIMLNVNVHVWEKDGKRGGYERISCFDRRRAKKTANVLYRGGVHFDQLIVSERSSGSTTPPLIPRSRRSNTPTQSPRRSTGGGPRRRFRWRRRGARMRWRRCCGRAREG